MLSDEVIVAVALGFPSLLIAVLALWVAYLTYQYSRCPSENYTLRDADRVSSWPNINRSMAIPTFLEYKLPAHPSNVRRRS
jgi:hypothetical protein